MSVGGHLEGQHRASEAESIGEHRAYLADKAQCDADIAAALAQTS